MRINDVAKIFHGRKGRIIGKYRKSSVMILLCQEKGEPHILFEVRAQHLRSQPGDVCLPGGKIEQEETPLEAAVRETKEELNLKDEDFEVLGEMDYFISPYGSMMYPFVASLKRDFIKPNEEEVEHIFKVPLSYFMTDNPLCYDMKIGPNLTDDFPFHLIKGGKDYKFSRGIFTQYFYQYDNYVIWGFTARIIKAFVDILKENNISSVDD